MCLLVVAWHVVPGAPVLIGANRDEYLSRPSTSMTVLRPAGPRVIGGRDEESGGTWLALNQHGVFAGLTNQPLGGKKDPSLRSRGELPLALATHRDATGAVEAFLGAYAPSDYNGSWLLVGDRDALYFIDFTGWVEPVALPLGPGLHVLENRALGEPSPKADHVAAALDPPPGDPASARDALVAVLIDHTEPPVAKGPDPPRASSNCVHLEGYGTRSSCLVELDDDPDGAPRVWVADGAPCVAPFVEVSSWWRSDPPR